MNVGIHVDGHIQEVEADVMNAVIICHNIYFAAINAILWLVIDVDVIDYKRIFSYLFAFEFVSINLQVLS
jgi:hypothetical protein